MGIHWEERNISAFTKELKRITGPAVESRTRKIAQYAVDTALEIAESELNHRENRAGKSGPSYFDAFTWEAGEWDGDSVSFAVGNEAEHADIIEYGSGAHGIPGPGGLKWPGWRSYSGGYAVSLRPGANVPHPGTRAYGIIGRAMNSAVQAQRRVGNRR